MTDTPVPDTGTQFAGLTQAERAIAAVHPHMSICDAPTIAECRECRVRLAVIRRDLAAVEPVIRRQVAGEIAWAIEHPIGPQEVRWAPIARRWMAESAAIARSHSTQPTEEETTNG